MYASETQKATVISLICADIRKTTINDSIISKQKNYYPMRACNVNGDKKELADRAESLF